MLVYYDNRLRLLLKQYLSIIFYSGSCACLGTV